MAISTTEMQFIAELTRAGFEVVGDYDGALTDYIIALRCARGGYTMSLAVKAAQNGLFNPARGNTSFYAWSALIDGISETALGDTAAELAEHVDSLIAIYSPESRFDFAHDSIRQIIQRPIKAKPSTEDVKTMEDALGLLERIFGEV